MTEPMPYSTDGKNIYSPGVGDDTICLVMMLMVAKYIIKNNLTSSKGILFVADSGEEGLGNLKGVKQIMKDFEGRIERLYTFDGTYDHMYSRCVGSHRYNLRVETKGGHSFSNFSNRNAICAAAELICALSKCQVPVEGDSTTTFNVGIIEGGTSVNTIAQNASFLYEYRSDTYACLEKMQAFFEETVAKAQEDPEAKITVDVIGIRPCGKEVDETVFNEMVQNVRTVCEKHTGIPCALRSGSTDANIPMSLGIPSVCVGNYMGGGIHTREEYLEIASVPVGLKITAEIILQYC
jgi:acetylornithine deacetylase/succinyl-diaminopimelate desuccinylase-like protein